MAGAMSAQNEIKYNLNHVIGPFLRQRGCKGCISDQRVQTKNRFGYLYSDTVIVCGTPVLSEEVKPRSLINPLLVVEATSASTVQRDHYEKFALYRQIASLRQYLLLSSEEMQAELYTLDEPGRWVFIETRDPNAVLDLSGIGCLVPLAEAYAGAGLPACPWRLPPTFRASAEIYSAPGPPSRPTASGFAQPKGGHGLRFLFGK